MQDILSREGDWPYQPQRAQSIFTTLVATLLLMKLHAAVLAPRPGCQSAWPYACICSALCVACEGPACSTCTHSIMGGKVRAGCLVAISTLEGVHEFPKVVLVRFSSD